MAPLRNIRCKLPLQSLFLLSPWHQRRASPPLLLRCVPPVLGLRLRRAFAWFVFNTIPFRPMPAVHYTCSFHLVVTCLSCLGLGLPTTMSPASRTAITTRTSQLGLLLHTGYRETTRFTMRRARPPAQR